MVPDWICEVLSPSTKSTDREVKIPIFAKYGVSYAWLVDPIEKILEAYKLDKSRQWPQLGIYLNHSMKFLLCSQSFGVSNRQYKVCFWNLYDN
jgi:Uma2 family endonuclease